LASLHGEESDDQSIPGEWDEFDKVKLMNKGPEEDPSKSSIDNPESVINDSKGHIDKRDDTDQLQQQEFIQITFKVKIHLYKLIHLFCF
jgi:hypothetical protein